MHRIAFAASGMLAVLLYGVAVVLGGLLWPAYSHIAQPVSDLIAARSPVKFLLDPIFFVYNLLTAVFGWGLLTVGKQHPSAALARAGAAGSWCLIVEALAGMLTLAFPEGEGGANSAIGLVGFAHILFAGLSSITSLLAIVLLGRSLAEIGACVWFRHLSEVVAIAVAVTGVVTGIAVANKLPWAGLAERSTIGGFLLWLAVVSVLRLVNASRPHARSAAQP